MTPIPMFDVTTSVPTFDVPETFEFTMTTFVVVREFAAYMFPMTWKLVIEIMVDVLRVVMFADVR